MQDSYVQSLREIINKYYEQFAKIKQRLDQVRKVKANQQVTAYESQLLSEIRFDKSPPERFRKTDQARMSAVTREKKPIPVI